MRNQILKFSFVVLLAAGLTGGFAGGCGSDKATPTGAAGSSGAGTGGGAGTTGTAGTGAAGTGAAGTGAAGTGAAGTGAAGSGSDGGAGTGSPDGGGADGPTPLQVHKDLLNAATTGGIAVTRTPAAQVYPTCP